MFINTLIVAQLLKNVLLWNVFAGRFNPDQIYSDTSANEDNSFRNYIH